MNILDFILLALILLSLFKGYSQGLIRAIGQLVGVVIGYIIAVNLYLFLASILKFLFLGNEAFAQIFAFVALFLVVIEGFGYLTDLLDILAKFPLISPINSWAGAILGLLVGNLTLGVILYFLSSLSLPDWLNNLIDTSIIAPRLIDFSLLLIGFLPWKPKI